MTIPSPEDDNTNHDDDDDDAAFEDSSQHVNWLNKDNGCERLGNKAELFISRVPRWEQVITHSKPNCIDSRRAPEKEKDIEKIIQRY